jgi:hypothetical protein
MYMVRHNTFGLGEVIRREEVNGFTYLWVRYENGKEVKLGIPFSFENGAVEALGSLKDEVDQAIAERQSRLAAPTPAAAPSAPTKRAAAKTMPTGPIPSAFEQYLIDQGYAIETDSGNPSTVYAYVNAVESIRVDEGISWDTLETNISSIVPLYDVGGAKELIGAKSNKTYINALKRFADFVGKP